VKVLPSSAIFRARISLKYRSKVWRRMVGGMVGLLFTWEKAMAVEVGSGSPFSAQPGMKSICR
jgi:hypothetical protein